MVIEFIVDTIYFSFNLKNIFNHSRVLKLVMHFIGLCSKGEGGGRNLQYKMYYMSTAQTWSDIVFKSSPNVLRPCRMICPSQ